MPSSNQNIDLQGIMLSSLNIEKQCFSKTLALILEDNSVAIYSRITNKIESILKSSKEPILGIFYNHSTNEFFILTSNYEINICSRKSGDFLKSLPYEKCKHYFNLRGLIEKNSKEFRELHDFNEFSMSNEQNFDKSFSLLEFNARYDEILIDYIAEIDKKKGPSFQLINEKFGDLKKNDLDENNDMNLVWSLNFSKELVFESKNVKEGCISLQLRLVEQKIVKHEDIAHILLIDCKRNMKDNHLINYLPFIFPFGFNDDLDEQVRELINFRLPIFDFNVGIQGCGTSFSFLLEKKENWHASSFLSTMQLMAIIVKKKLRNLTDKPNFNELKNANFLTNANG